MTSPSKIPAAPFRKGMMDQIAQIVGIMALLMAVGIGMFLMFFNRYNDSILYAERLSQMQDITTQLFAGLEDVVGSQWNTVDVLCNYVSAAQPDSTAKLQQFMTQQAMLNNLDPERDSLIAVDNHGRYYTTDGLNGTLQELNYLLSDPARISYVSNTLTTNRTKMVYLKRLSRQAPLEDGSTLVYYGLTRDMDALEPYFDCAAYEGSSGVYVVDSDGLKLFRSSSTNDSSGALIQGYNAYHVLEKMEYRHGSSFDAAKTELEQNGLTYSNAVLNGNEYFYSMYRMENAEWTLLFLVNSDAVATNTVELVDTTTKMLLVFAVFMVVVSGACLFLLIQTQHKREMEAEERSRRALEHANSKLEAANRDLEKAKDAASDALILAENANQAKTDFLSSMSHDIRTPLNAIMGITELMERDSSDPEKLHVRIEKLRSAGEHLLDLINDVLDMNRIESGKASLTIEKMNLADQLAYIDDLVRPQMQEHGHTYTLHTEHIRHENLYGDAVRLRQVLVNILSNAIKYTPDGGRIDFVVSELPREGQFARYAFSVTDTGIGMSEEYLTHVFDSFSRAESTLTNRVQGSGLGMAITKNIVTLMGGTIRVESQLGKGSCFEVVLDFKIDTEADENIDALDILIVNCPGSTLSRIMDATSRVPVHVASSEDFDQAVEYLHTHKVDCVLAPFLRTNPTRFQRVERVRAAAQGPVVALGMGEWPTEEVMQEARDAGLDGYITTPFFLSRLVREVKRVQQAQTEPDSAEETSALRGMKFLCAEDNALNAEILAAMLDMEGASCLICSNGAEAVEAFEKAKPGDYDAILMDIQMPVMNGLDAARAIRASKNPLGQTIPIVAMTANAFSDDIQRSMEAGMDAHLSKPIDMKLVERTMRKFRVTPPPEKLSSLHDFFER